jgi:hypothetical protein
VRRTIQTLRRAQRPCFVWCHLMSVHEYHAPETITGFHSPERTPLDPEANGVGRVRAYGSIEAAIDSYDDSILYVDALLGKLFRYVQTEKPNTLLIVTSDHGEEFYDHGGFGHGFSLYNELLHVPLVIWGPGVPRAVSSEPTSHVDLMPTLARYLGFPRDKSLPGRVLFADGSLSPGRDVVFAEQHQHGPWRRFALYQDGAKFIQSEKKDDGKVRLEYYAEGSGKEGVNGVQELDGVTLRSLEAGVRERREGAQQYFASHVGSEEMSALEPHEVETLKALGYVE